MTAIASDILDIHRTDDFAVTGRGDHPAWAKAQPVPLTCRENLDPTGAYKTWCKSLWSSTGLYFYFDCTDRKLTCSGLPDFGDLWTEDVAEVFLWPDERVPLYFEYNISPLGSELAIICPHFVENYGAWRAWHYEGARRTQHACAVRGGPAVNGADITGWSTEFFLPLALLTGLPNMQIKEGQRWRINMFRIDRDEKPARYFAWRDCGRSFHNYREYGTIQLVG